MTPCVYMGGDATVRYGVTRKEGYDAPVLERKEQSLHFPCLDIAAHRVLDLKLLLLLVELPADDLHVDRVYDEVL